MDFPAVDGARAPFRYAAMTPAERTVLRERFAGAIPFPHIVLDDFLTVSAAEVAATFPAADWPGWKRFDDAYQHQKRTCSDLEAMPAFFQRLVFQLSSPSFLGFMHEVTGINALLPDPYLAGGGLHSSGPGGILAPHADFHAYGKLNLFRQVNVLVYLNPHWEEGDGGQLELFRKGEDEPSVAVVPKFGRMVMFRTDDRSIHGFTNPVAPGKWRNSLALYYYTSADDARFSGDGVTYWQRHGAHTGAQKARLLAYKGLQRGAWTLSKMAHRVNPNFRQHAGKD